jgi:hypothetical protein
MINWVVNISFIPKEESTEEVEEGLDRALCFRDFKYNSQKYLKRDLNIKIL